MKRIFFALALLLLTPSLFAQNTSQEKEVWTLEHNYWMDVQTNDLNAYKKLWHPDFVGWPMSSEKPARKAGITNWIAQHTTKGEHLQSFKLEEAASQSFGNIVVTHYWITQVWAAGEKTENSRARITHTWLKTDADWQIVGGMSAPVEKFAENAAK